VSWWRLALPVYWIALAAATHYPRVRIPGELPSSDKILHFAAFAILAFLLWQVLASRARPLTAASVWIVAAIAIPYAAVDEYTQQFVGRYTELADWVANAAGIICVLAVLEIRRRVTAVRAARRSSPARR
jgi:VanZ family protein